MTGPRSLLIGAGSLAQQCGDVLRTAGHQLTCVVTDDASLAGWADAHGLPRRPCAEIAAVVRGEPPDYLFSVVNATVLDGDTLARVGRLAINYHDAPLPRYAGMHATSWALLAGETSYAISWHVVAARIDAGGLLRQPAVPIAADDTAFRLNGRCWAVAIESFTELVTALAAGDVRPRAQDLASRSYFARDRKPAAAGALCWDAPALAAERMVRALDFGSQPNPLAAAKLVLPTCALVVRKAALGAPTAAPPGRVLRGEADQLVVACADRELIIRELEDTAGSPIDLRRLALSHGLAPDAQLAVLDAAARRRLELWAARCARHERAWALQLRELRPAVAGCDLGARRSGRGELAGHGTSRAMLAALTAYLGRTIGGDAVDVALSTPALRALGAPEVTVFADAVPLRLPVRRTGAFADLADAATAALARCEQQASYPRDLIGRMPCLRGRPPQLAIGVMMLGDDEHAALVPATAITLAWRPSSGAWWLVRDPAALTARDGELIAACLARLAGSPSDAPLAELAWPAPAVTGTAQLWPGTGALACSPASTAAAAALDQALARGALRADPVRSAPVVIGRVAELRDHLDAGHPVAAACVVEPIVRPRELTELTAALGRAPLWHAYVAERDTVIAVGPAGAPLRAVRGVAVCALGADGAPVPAGLLGQLAIDTGEGWRTVDQRGRVWPDDAVECFAPLTIAPRREPP